MLKLMPVGVMLMTLGLSATAIAQDQAAVPLPDEQVMQRTQESTPKITGYQLYDPFGAPIDAPEAMDESEAGSANDVFADSAAGGPLPLAPDSAEAP